MTNNAKTNEMREELIERAKAFIDRHVKQLPLPVQLNGITQAEKDEAARMCADFAADVLAEREAWLERATRFEIVPNLPWSLGTSNQRPVNIESRGQQDGSRKWVVSMQEWVLNRSGEFEWEPMPSSRTDEFLASTRFDSYEEALEAFQATKQENNEPSKND